MYGHISAVLADKGRQVYATAPSASVRDAVGRMIDAGVGAMLVVDQGQPIGIFTERDVLRRVVNEGRDPNTTRVSEVMTTEVAVIEPDATVEQAMAIMTQKRCRHLPVMGDGEVIGVISIGDLTRWVSLNQQVEIQHLVDYITGRYPA